MFNWLRSFFPRRRYSLSGTNWMDGDDRTEAQVVNDGQLAEAKTNWWHGFAVGVIATVALMLFGLTLLGYFGNFLSWLNTIELTALSLLVLVVIGLAINWVIRAAMRNSYERPGPFNGKLDRYGKRKKKEPAPTGSKPKSNFLRKWGFGTDHQGGGS